MRYDKLNLQQKDYIREIYRKYDHNREEAQRMLAEYFDVTTRTIRNWVNYMGLLENEYDSENVLIYDLETSLCLFDAWWPHKQYVSWEQMHEEPRIITVAWKWLHEEKVYTERWEDVRATPVSEYDVAGWGNDRKLVETFASVYNRADLAIGVNSDNFDKRFLAQRCLVQDVPFNRFVRSLDIQKSSKKEFRAPSYSMKFSAQRLGVAQKHVHEGRSMWRKAQYHKDPEVRSEAISAMERYNIGDIIATEEWYLKLVPYIDHKIHFGTLKAGHEKWSCPNCGSQDVELYHKTATAAGTIQYVMRCREDGQLYKIPATAYTDFLNKRTSQIEKFRE